MSTADRVKQIITKHLGVDPAKVVPGASFDSLGADSLDRIELVIGFETEFGVEVPDDVAESWTTVSDAVAGLDGLLAAGR